MIFVQYTHICDCGGHCNILTEVVS